jgi:hypothetical protein
MLLLPLPGGWLPNPSTTLFQTGPNLRISICSATGIHTGLTRR